MRRRQRRRCVSHKRLCGWPRASAPGHPCGFRNLVLRARWSRFPRFRGHAPRGAHRTHRCHKPRRVTRGGDTVWGRRQKRNHGVHKVSGVVQGIKNVLHKGHDAGGHCRHRAPPRTRGPLHPIRPRKHKLPPRQLPANLYRFAPSFSSQCLLQNKAPRHEPGSRRHCVFSPKFGLAMRAILTFKSRSN